MNACKNPHCDDGKSTCGNPMHRVFWEYRRTNIAEMRPYVSGEDLTKISVSDVDSPDEDMGMVARNPKNHDDQWYVARQYFDDNFERA